MTADELEALRLPESDVYHYTRGDGALCGTDTSGGRLYGDDAQIVDLESASQFFRLCSTCEKVYHPELDMTTSEIRGGIREAIDSTENSGTFTVHELMAIHEALQGDEDHAE